MKKTFYDKEKQRQVAFYYDYLSQHGVRNNGVFRGEHEFILNGEDCLYNLFFEPICYRDGAVQYFDRYKITWWGENKKEKKPTGHLVSSQIHCLNHLFFLRKDKDAVKAIIAKATGLEIDRILPSPLDADGYITFEFVYKNKSLLGEKNETRGAKCTSVDALVYALLKTGKRVLIPIEWKYTETYPGTEANETSLCRYPTRILPFSNLKGWNDLYKADPYYELMRQTLLVEQIIANKEYLEIKADDYLHLVVVPEEHTELRDAITKQFVPTLKDPSKLRLIDPKDLLDPLKDEKQYSALFAYLSKRYW